MNTPEIIPLRKVPTGSHVVVVHVPEGKSRSQLIRLGIHAGELLRCLQRLPGGTMLVEKNRQEIALGASLAGSILVRMVTA